MKKIIIIGLFSILIVFNVAILIKCYKLEQANIKLMYECVQQDSIKMENKVLNEKVILLSDDLNQCKQKIDSLKSIKQRVIIQKEYVVSENLTEGVRLLKENLKWERQ